MLSPLAPVCPPPENEIVGILVYPAPTLVIVSFVTEPFLTSAVAVATVVGLPPPVKVTVGAEVYKVPPSVSVTSPTVATPAVVKTYA